MKDNCVGWWEKKGRGDKFLISLVSLQVLKALIGRLAGQDIVKVDK